jgi:hypothetical protein
VEAGYSTDYTDQATTSLDGGTEETTYESNYNNGNGNGTAAANAQPTNPFTKQQYQQVPGSSTNPFMKK